MAIDFPNSPSTNDTHTVSGRTWIWDGSTWNLVALTGPTGATGEIDPLAGNAIIGFRVFAN